MKVVSLYIFFTVLTLSGYSQDNIQWLTWEEALEAFRTEKRKIVVDVYTDWCGWCKKMDERTYSHQSIVTEFTDNYYAIKFNAEHKDDIVFNNKIYRYVRGFGGRGYHELAQEIMNGRMSYPTTVFIDENLDVIQPIPGFQGVITFKMILDYFSGNFYTHMPWHKFEENYKLNTAPVDTRPQVQPVKNH